MNSNAQLKAWIEMAEKLRHAPGWEAEQPVEMKQTHISVVLLGRRRVLKLKKPVDFGFLDYTTVEKRHRACEAEVRLNRRLCADMYLGVIPVYESDGGPSLAGGNEIIDYGVLMKRLPADRMLDEMVRRGTVTEAIIERVAARLSEFHRTAARGSCAVDENGSWQRIQKNWTENFEQTEQFIGRTIGEDAYAYLREWVAGELRRNQKLIECRVRSGKIVDGHGDVRCESVCIVNGICIFDCIEFNDRFRYVDVANEAAFLAMDLDSLGRPDLGYFFTECYETHSPDAEFFRLLPFYRCYRAYVRGKVLSFRLDEPEFTSEEKQRAAERASAFFEMARRYASRLPQRTVIVVSGLAGTGKTSLARAMASELGMRAVSTDDVRQRLFGTGRGSFGFNEGPYQPEARRRTYDALFDRAKTLLDRGESVILDGTFLDPEQRIRAIEVAERADARFREIHCSLSPDEVRRRIERRQMRGEGTSEATWEIHLRQRAAPEHTVDAVRQRLTIDTKGNLAACARQAADWLRACDGTK